MAEPALPTSNPSQRQPSLTLEIHYWYVVCDHFSLTSVLSVWYEGKYDDVVLDAVLRRGGSTDP